MDPAHAEPCGQEPVRLLGGQHGQHARPGVVGGDQPAQVVAAGHDHQAPRRTGQQRPDVRGVAGVVQHQQHPPVGEQRAVQRDLRLVVARHVARGHAERVEEPAHGVGGVQHRAAGVETPQVHVELPVGEAVGDAVRPPHRDGRLADARRAGQRGDHHRVAPLGQQRVQFGELVVAAGEARQVGGQLPGDEHGGLRGRGCRRRREDLLVQVAQLRARVHAELVGQPAADLVVVPQRLPLLPGAVQGEHELRGGAFVQRVLRGQLRQHGGRLAVQPRAQPEVDQVQPCPEPFARQDVPRHHQPRRVQPRERLTGPQPERLGQERGGLVLRARPGLGHQRAEPVQVDRLRVGDQRVPARAALHHGVVAARQRRAQPRHVAVQGLAGASRGLVGPHPVHQRVHRHHPADVHQQQRQQAPLLPMPDLHDVPVDQRPDLAQQREPRPHDNSPPAAAPLTAARPASPTAAGGARFDAMATGQGRDGRTA